MHIWDGNNPPPVEELRLSNLAGNGKLENGRYSWEKKYATVVYYLANGSLADTEREMGVPVDTLENWRKSEWWPRLVDEIRAAQESKFKNKLTRLIDKTLGIIEDRLENGDRVVTKGGDVVDVPINLRDATRAATALMQQKNHMEKNALQQIVQQASVQEVLKELTKGFADMWRKQNNSTIVLEEVSDAVYEERKEGL